MNGIEMLEKLNAIDLDYVQEAEKPFKAAKRPRGKIIMLYAVGMAASFVMLLVSASMLMINGNMIKTETGTVSGWAATAFGESGSLPLILLILSIAALALFAFLIIRRKKRD